MDAPPYRRTADDVAGELATDLGRGLSKPEAGARLLRFGRNELAKDAPIPTWRRLLVQLRGPLTLLLLAAAALSLLVWDLEAESGWPYEALTVLAVVALNAVLSVLQEGRSERALQALSALTPLQALVFRDGEVQTAPAAEVVPGDVLLLEEGQAVPADARIFESAGLRTAEAALTGESTPVTKDPAVLKGEADLGDRINMVLAGSTVVGGRGRAVVTETGMRSELGRVAGLLQQTAQETTPLQREMDRVGRFLGKAVLLIAAVVSLPSSGSSRPEPPAPFSTCCSWA